MAKDRNGFDLPEVIAVPVGDVVADSAAGAAAQITATLAGVAGRRTFICGFQVTGAGATAASTVEVTVTGVGTTLRYKVPVPAGAGVAITPLMVTLPVPVPASADNTAIVVTVPTFGAGNTAVAVAAQGYRL